MIWPDLISVSGPSGRYTVRGQHFSIVVEDGKYDLAVHPTIGNPETITITEQATGLAVITDIDARLIDFPEVLIPRCRDAFFEVRCMVGDQYLLERIEFEAIRLAERRKELDDDIPF